MTKARVGRRREGRDLERLVDTAKRVSASLELDAVLTAIVEDATTLFGASSGDMLLWERDRGVLRVVAVAEFPPEMVGYEMRFGEGLSSQAIRARRTIQVDDYAAYPHRAPHLEHYRFGAVLCAPLLFRGAAIGTINVHAAGSGRRFDAADADLLQAFAGLAAIAIDHARRFEALEQRALGDAIGELVGGSASSIDGAFARRMAGLGLDAGAPRDLLLVAVGSRTETDDARIGRCIRRIDELLQREAPGSVVAPIGGVMIVLARRDRPARLASPRAVADVIRRAIRESLGETPIAIAIGDPCVAIADYAESYRLARDALGILASHGHDDATVETRHLGAERLLLKSVEPDELRDFAWSTLGPLVEYDRRNGTDLIPTLRAYLAEDRHQRRAATRLFVHVNTLVYRIGRIEALLERDLRDPAVVFELTLALRVWDAVGRWTKTQAWTSRPSPTGLAQAQEKSPTHQGHHLPR
jgi:sugar diacid utilization regulator